MIIDGRKISGDLLEQVRQSADRLRNRGAPVTLAAVLIGDDAAAGAYAQSQARRAGVAGVDYRLFPLPVETTQQQAADALLRLGADPRITGLMLHLPVPRHLDSFSLQRLIPREKDVEGVNPENLGMLFMGRDALAPCTAAAAFECARFAAAELAHQVTEFPGFAGRHAVVIGRSVIVGKPVAALLLAAHATVTQCHTRTRDLAEHTRRADLLVVAAGVPHLIGREHVRPGAIVIDVGMHVATATTEGGSPHTQTIGDVRFAEVAELAGAITPVPGGVGPVTVAMLLRNTVHAAERMVKAQ